MMMRWMLRALLTVMAIVASNAQLMCDSTEEGRAKISQDALERLSADFNIIQGNLSFHVGGNPAGRYGVIFFPPQLLPPALQNASRSTGAFPIPLNLSFLMGPQDAVLWFGCTPPPVRYFSIRSYLAFRFEKNVHNLSSISGYMPAAEFADPLNNAVIQTTGGPHDPFSKTTLVVSTGDGATNRHVRQAFKSAGFSEHAMNLDVIPTEKTRFRDRQKPWALDLSDTIAWQYRVNEFINPSEANAYLDTVWPVYLLRPKYHLFPSPSSSPSASGRHHKHKVPTLKPLSAPAFRTRGNGKSEEWLRPALNKLINIVKERMSEERGLELTHQFQLTPNTPDNDRCMVDQTYCPVAKPVPQWNKTMCIPTCDWFSRDSLYSLPADDSDFINMNYPENRTLVILGVNHPLVGKSSFLNILVTGINNPERPGHTPNFSSSHLAGSGEYYMPEEPDSSLLFAQVLSRNCGEREPFCELVTNFTISYDEDIFFAERAYLEALTAIGPSADEIIPPLLTQAPHHSLPTQIFFAERAYLEVTTAIGPSADEIISPLILAFDPPTSSSSSSTTSSLRRKQGVEGRSIKHVERMRRIKGGEERQPSFTFQVKIDEEEEEGLVSLS